MPVIDVKEGLVRKYIVKCAKCGFIDEILVTYPEIWLCRKCSQLNFE